MDDRVVILLAKAEMYKTAVLVYSGFGAAYTYKIDLALNNAEGCFKAIDVIMAEIGKEKQT